MFIFASCSTKNQLVYLNDSDKENFNKIDYSRINYNIESGDILKIDVSTVVPEASLPYNRNNNSKNGLNNIDVLKLDGYLVNTSMMINFPILGKLSVNGLSLVELENKIIQLLIEGGHLSSPTVHVQRVNSKFTFLGEVRNPGTFSFFEGKLNLFQALGYAGDLTIEGKRNNITLIREENGLRKVYKIDLTHSELLKKPYYYVKNNDVIIISPNYSKVKSAGFIGSSSSIASVASLLLSITLLIINK